jgi:arsenite methyltransferase
MLSRARQNRAKSPDADIISFVEANITSMPLPAAIADCIISNCVINLVPEPEKPAVFMQMAHLLKSGGRVAISDILALKPLPTTLKETVAAYVGCVSGASVKEDYIKYLEEAGFSGV